MTKKANLILPPACTHCTAFCLASCLTIPTCFSHLPHCTLGASLPPFTLQHHLYLLLLPVGSCDMASLNMLASFILSPP